DLDWIVMKALEKDRTRRYETASDLAADVRRHLLHEPVVAGPPGAAYRFRKFVRRNRVSVLAGGLVVGALVIGFAVAIFGLVQARREASRSEEIAGFLQNMLASTDSEQSLEPDVDVARVVATARKVFGDDHATVAAALVTRAVQLQGAGHLDAAEPLLRQAINIWRETGGENSLNLASALSKLGSLLLLKGDDLGAEEVYREALRIDDAVPGGDRVLRSVALFYYAAVHTNRGDFERADELLQESIRLRRAAAPNQRLQIAILVSARTNLLFVTSADRDELDAALDESVEAWRDALPPDSVTLAKVIAQVGVLKLRMDLNESAEAHLREAAEMYMAAEDPPVIDFLMTLKGLADILEKGEFLALLRRVVGEDDPFLGEALGEYAGILEKKQGPAEALPIDMEAVVVLQRTGGDPERIEKEFRAIQRLAWDIACRADQTAEGYEAALAGARFFLEAHPDDYLVVNTLGVLEYRLGRYEDALATLSRSDAHFSEIYEGGVPEDVAFIAMAQKQLGDDDAARAALARLRELMQQPRNADDRCKADLLAEAERLIEPSDE
ncbi:MAG: tetratricopeptide repeat protein, partial [Planctomycetota bacterium]